MKVGLVRPVAIESLIGFPTMTVSMNGVLVGTGSDLKPKIEQTFRVVFCIAGFFRTWKGEERSGQSMRASIDLNLIIVPLVGL